MYTQCPECSSIFEISATDLAVAGGFVRCGQCAVSFDALNSLSDNSAALKTRSRPSKAKSTLQSLKTQGSSTPATKKTISADKNDTAARQSDSKNDQPEKDPEVSAAETPKTDQPQTGSAQNLNESSTVTDDSSIDEPSVQPGEVSDEPEVRETSVDSAAAAAATKATKTVPDDVADSDDADSDEDDDDEILLDESYQPPLVNDDDELYDDEDYDDTLVAADKIEASSESDASGAMTVAGSGPDDDEFGLDEIFDDEITPSESIADATDNAAESAEAADSGADESALFALPLPELTTLEHNQRTVLPEKLEGGEAAHDPSAQTRQAQARTDTRIDTQENAQANVPEPSPSIWARLQNDAYDAQDARDLKNYLSPPVNPVTRAAWLAGSAFLVLLLIGQVIHRNRGDLVIHPRLGPVISNLYSGIGLDLRPNWRVNAYKIVGQARLFLMPLDDDDALNIDESDDGATASDQPEATAIRFVAIISNGAKQPQPPPLVRLTLRDRWGDPTGARDFSPPEYLADRAMIGQLLEPGQRLRVVLNLYDFGSDAVGFDFDMCLPDDQGILRCAHEG